MSDSGERELFEGARENNRTAFDRLQDILDPSVRRFVRRLVGVSEAEDDIVRDAFLALYMNLERLESQRASTTFPLPCRSQPLLRHAPTTGTLSVCSPRRSFRRFGCKIPPSSQIAANNPMSSCTGDCFTLRCRKQSTIYQRFSGKR